MLNPHPTALKVIKNIFFKNGYNGVRKYLKSFGFTRDVFCMDPTFLEKDELKENLYSQIKKELLEDLKSEPQKFDQFIKQFTDKYVLDDVSIVFWRLLDSGDIFINKNFLVIKNGRTNI